MGMNATNLATTITMGLIDMPTFVVGYGIQSVSNLVGGTTGSLISAANKTMAPMVGRIGASAAYSGETGVEALEKGAASDAVKAATVAATGGVGTAVAGVVGTASAAGAATVAASEAAAAAGTSAAATAAQGGTGEQVGLSAALGGVGSAVGNAVSGIWGSVSSAFSGTGESVGGGGKYAALTDAQNRAIESAPDAIGANAVANGTSAAGVAASTASSLSLGDLLKVGAAGFQLYGGIAGYNTAMQGAKDQARLQNMQAVEAWSLGDQQTKLAEGEADVAKGEAAVAVARAGLEFQRAGIEEERAKISVKEADVAEDVTRLHSTKIAALQKEADIEVEGELKKTNAARAKARVSAAGRGVMLENRATSATNIEEQDINAEAAWSVGRIAEKNWVQQTLEHESMKISAKNAAIARSRASVAYGEASLAYTNAMIAYMSAGVASSRAGLAAMRVPYTYEKTHFDSLYQMAQARATRRAGQLTATNSLVSGFGGAATSLASIFV